MLSCQIIYYIQYQPYVFGNTLLPMVFQYIKYVLKLKAFKISLYALRLNKFEISDNCLDCDMLKEE